MSEPPASRWEGILDGVDRALADAPKGKRIGHAAFWRWCDKSVVPAVNSVLRDDVLCSTLYDDARKLGVFWPHMLRKNYDADDHWTLLIWLVLASYDEAPDDEARPSWMLSRRVRKTRHKDRQSYRNMVSNVCRAIGWLRDTLAKRIRDFDAGMGYGRASGIGRAAREGLQVGKMRAVMRSVLSEIQATAESKGGGGTSMPQYVTMDQAAAIVSRSKRTLRGYYDNGDMPEPEIRGKGGTPHEWQWEKLRPWLQETFKRPLPERYPVR